MQKKKGDDRIAIETKSAKETQQLGAIFFETIRGDIQKKTARVISLEGDLGAGKTTFMQGFAGAAGVKESIQSPTFVIMRLYRIAKKKNPLLLVHIDAYRIGAKDLQMFGWDELLQNKNAVICIEWGSRVKNILPSDALRVRFRHEKKDKRVIDFSYVSRKK